MSDVLQPYSINANRPPENPYVVMYPESIRPFIEKLHHPYEPLTFKEAEQVCRVLTRMITDVSEMLVKAHREMYQALQPVISAAQYMEQILEEQRAEQEKESE